MSSASSAHPLITSIEQAEKDLALYAAIIGCKPTVAPPEPEALVQAEEPAPDSHMRINPDPTEPAEPPHPHKLSIWMRHLSHEAKRRIHEAAMRLAS